MTELMVIARHTMAAGQEHAVLAVLPRLIEASRREPENLSFTAYRQIDDPSTYVLLERYASAEAFAAHRETPHFQEFLLGEILPRLAERVIETFDVAQ